MGYARRSQFCSELAEGVSAINAPKHMINKAVHTLFGRSYGHFYIPPTDTP
jgi:hypothetical protein